MTGHDEVELTADPQAPARARRFLTDALRAAADLPADLVEDARLVATELVSNAVLHGRPPVVVRVRRLEGGVRVEVADRGPGLPLPPHRDQDAMTGRGLGMVHVLASGWGIDPSPRGGKTVWVELVAGRPGGAHAAEVDVDALLASFPDDTAGPPLVDVRLPGVPVDLVLACRAHVDDVVRELSLDPAPGRAALAERLARRSARTRAEVERQALAAAARGETTIDLALSLPLEAAEAAEEHLAALEEVDRHASAERLLTRAAPAVQQVYRRWYAASLAAQVRARVAGGEVPRLPALVEVLAGQVTELSALRLPAERLRLLQRVTADLAGATTVQQISHTVLSSAEQALSTVSGRVFVLDEARGVLRSVVSQGGTQEWVQRYDEIDLRADLPGPEVLRTGRPMVLRSRAQIAQRYPVLAGVYAEDCALHVVPLLAGERRLGVLSLRFPPGDALDRATQGEFVQALAGALAQALGRALAVEELALANARLASRLEDVTRVAVAAQRAILAPPPPVLGAVALSARYVSAAAEALVGGDLYEVLRRPGAVRLLVGDVRGKGLAAVRTATVVMGEFRAAAADVDDLAEAARQVDRRLRPHLGPEDFVTALLAEVRDDGTYVLASCGHPPALVVHGRRAQEVQTSPSLPLGLGADPLPVSDRLAPGDRLLLCTDGALEARDPAGRFVPLQAVVGPAVTEPVATALDGVLACLRAAAGPDLGDDLALLLVEYLGGVPLPAA